MSDERASGPQQRRDAAEAAQLVREFEASGQTRREFCGERGLSIWTLDAYRKQQRKAQRTSGGGSRFVAVSLGRAKEPQEPNAADSGVTLILGRGRRIEVKPGFDGGTLEELVRLLERL